MEYKQQQSPVFVFSTQMANQAADALMSGQFPSINECHGSAAKGVLEKHPLNEQQFKRSPGSRLNNSTQFKQIGAKGMKANLNSHQGMKECGLSSNVLNNQYPSFRGNCNRACDCPFTHGPAGCPGRALRLTGYSDPNWPPMSDVCADFGWQTQQFANNNSPNVPPNIRHPNSMMTARGCNAVNNPRMSPNSFSNNQMCFPQSNCGMQMPSSLPTGTKVPDENLTPQQRQHREEKLAKNHWLQIMLNVSEPMNNQQSSMPHRNMRMPAPHQQMGDLCGPGMMASCAPFSTVSHGDHSNDPIGSNINNPSSFMVPNSAMGNCTQNHSNMPPNCAQLECQKMQHQFFEDRRRICLPQLSGSSHPSSMLLNSPNPSIAPSRGKQMAGPPPPYRQDPTPLSSLHPSFAEANSSSLSLPSPQIQSPVDSSQPFPTGTFEESDFSVNWAEFTSVIKPAMQVYNWNSPEMCSLNNEPQLDPVPSPEQIQYLDFEGQELTIQKQPNTSLRETDLMSSPELNFGSDFNSPHFPRGMENRNGYTFPGENHVNHRFTSTNMCHPHFDIPPNQRLIVSGDGTVQRFNNPSFEHSRMPPPMDVGSQQMGSSIPCPTFNGPRMDGTTLDELPLELSLHWMQYLTPQELCSCRAVSKQLRLFADKQRSLNEAKKEFKISGKYENGNHFKFLCGLYCRVKKVSISHLHTPELDFGTILKLCSKYIKNIESLEISCFGDDTDIYACNRGNSHLIADYFSNIKSLTLFWVSVDDQNMSCLFKKLANLQNLDLDYTNVSGLCFSDINENICSIKWYVDSDTELSRRLTLNGKGAKMKYFSFQCGGYVDSELMIPFVNEMENLTTLKIDRFAKLRGWFCNLRNVENLVLRCTDIVSSVWNCFTEPWTRTRKLIFKTEEVTEDNISAFLRNFPNAEELRISFIDLDKFSSLVIQSLRSLRSLRLFTLTDNIYKVERYMTLEGSEKNALIESIRAMDQVVVFKLYLDTYETEESHLVDIIEKICSIGSQRPNHEFHLECVGSFIPQNDLPPNVFIDIVNHGSDYYYTDDTSDDDVDID